MPVKRCIEQAIETGELQTATTCQSGGSGCPPAGRSGRLGLPCGDKTRTRTMLREVQHQSRLDSLYTWPLAEDLPMNRSRPFALAVVSLLS
ncbi:hypothetical protein LY78DRAFT_655022 [Colletotrichum sublineola]|nr:hypothetical protein LY78DRAFT_655022 [Colletotrichum sublineola]